MMTILYVEVVMAQAGGKNENVEQKFRDLYYHLYSNSNSSRSERILSDLSKLILLLSRIQDDRTRVAVAAFESGVVSANESLLPEVVRHYGESVSSEDRFGLDDDSLRGVLPKLRDIDLIGSPSHTFGDAFQALIGPRVRGDKGQFFTPRSVVRAMVDVLGPSPDSLVIDPACGTGGFLSTVLDRWRDTDGAGRVVGIDKDRDLSLLATAVGSVHGSPERLSTHHANSLSWPTLEALGVREGAFDFVVTNPPFGSKIGITDSETLSRFSLGHVWEQGEAGWTQAGSIRASQDPQILFIELCIRLLKPGGRMAIVLPEGVFGNSGSGYVWEYVRNQGAIVGLIDCPRTTFQPGTDTKTNILFFEKGARLGTAWISVAYHCGHDKRGRSIAASGRPIADDFELIALDWNRPEPDRLLWSAADISETDYLVPRYHDRKLADEVAQDAQRLKVPVVTLGELIKAGEVSIRKGHEVGSEAYGAGDIPFVRTSDIHNLEISYDPTNCVSEEVYQRFAEQQQLRRGDILMVVDGRYRIGRCAILHDGDTRCVVQSHLRIVSVSDKSKIDPIGLLFSLSLPSVQREIRRLVFIQSTLGALGRRINEIRIPDPRDSNGWGDSFSDFRTAVIERAKFSRYLRQFGAEVEL